MGSPRRTNHLLRPPWAWGARALTGVKTDLLQPNISGQPQTTPPVQAYIRNAVSARRRCTGCFTIEVFTRCWANVGTIPYQSEGMFQNLQPRSGSCYKLAPKLCQLTHVQMQFLSPLRCSIFRNWIFLAGTQITCTRLCFPAS